MKQKLLRMALLMVLAVAALCVSAAATEYTGIYGVTSEAGVTITPDGTLKTDATIGSNENQTIYAGAVKVQVDYTAAAKGEYLLVVLDGDTAIPDSSNIVYIDQLTAESGDSLKFTVYPKTLNSGTTYSIYVVTNASGTSVPSQLTKVGAFSYYSPEPEYILGDADMSGDISALDAYCVLQAIVGKYDLNGAAINAADADKDGEITALDAMCILQKIVA
jgi:hypothetical protein